MSGIVSLLEGERKRKRWVGVDGVHLPLLAYIMVAIGTAIRFPNLVPVYSHTCRQLDVQVHMFTEETDRYRQEHARSNAYTIACTVWLAFLQCHVTFINTEGAVVLLCCLLSE